eukprot:TRINITY_DN185_c0_g1_i3.p1 TRINITY_DN185_c0_g1~~TRINITY_DN185_c0_g1_i3.p1  ORF type:complete len:620 (+),score=192.08 TRINITY_DN185_c0_g1_i3:184-2043(+)
MSLSYEEKQELKKVFDSFDVNHDGHLDAQELAKAVNAHEEHKITGVEARDLIKQIDANKDGQVSFPEFLEIVEGNRKAAGKAGAAFLDAVRKTQAGTHVQKVGAYSATGGDTAHSYSEEEKIAFVDWVNDCLGQDPDLAGRMPIKAEGEGLFQACTDGILLCKLINEAMPDTIDERVINKKGLSLFKKSENHVLCINSAKAIGCNVVNIGPNDLTEGRPYLIMGLIWQIIKIGLFARINLSSHPELYRLLEEGESIDDLLKLPIEEILLRWFNHHLKNSGSPRRVKNFHNDIKDSECYTILLKQIAPKGSGVDTRALAEPNMDKRAGLVLGNADKIGCKKFLKPRDIVTGNAKLNLAFVANLFNMHPSLEPVDNSEFEIIEETREEKSMRNWMNSLGVDPFVKYLYEDLRDGIILIQLFEKVYPGIVDQKRVNYPPWKAMGGEMKKIENCNYAVALAKQVGFSVVGIDGKNVYDKNKMLTLSVVWQLMRAYVLEILRKLSQDGKPISEAQIVAWVNTTLKNAGKHSQIGGSGFKDPALGSGVIILDLVDAIQAGSVDYGLVAGGDSPDDQLSNAKLAISTARRAGAVVFALPEDVVEVKPKMMMTIFASLMAVGLGVRK